MWGPSASRRGALSQINQSRAASIGTWIGEIWGQLHRRHQRLLARGGEDPEKKKSFWVGVLLSGPVIIFRGPCNDDECCCSMHAKEICRKRKRGGAEGSAAFWSKRFSSIFWAEVDVINYRQHIVKISCKVLSPSNAFPVAPTFLELVWASCRRLGRLDAELTMDEARSGSAFRTALCYGVITAVDI